MVRKRERIGQTNSLKVITKLLDVVRHISMTPRIDNSNENHEPVDMLPNKRYSEFRDEDLTDIKNNLLEEIISKIDGNYILKKRLNKLLEIEGLDKITATALTIYLPKLGKFKKGQASSYIGVPKALNCYQKQNSSKINSSKKVTTRQFYSHKLRFIRQILYRCVYSMVQVDKEDKKDKNRNPYIAEYYDSRSRKSKSDTHLLGACMRKLIEACNVKLRELHN